jgi:hypothetical protein
LVLHQWAAQTDAAIVHWKVQNLGALLYSLSLSFSLSRNSSNSSRLTAHQNAKHVDGRFGEGAYATLLKTLEKNRMDDKNLVARPEMEENEAVAWLANTFEAHNPWVPKNYVLAYAQVWWPQGMLMVRTRVGLNSFLRIFVVCLFFVLIVLRRRAA